MAHTDANNRPSERMRIATGFAYCLVQQETLRDLRRVVKAQELDDGQVVRGVLNAFLAQQEWLAKITTQAQLECQQREQAMSEFFEKFRPNKSIPGLPVDLTTIEYQQEASGENREVSTHASSTSEESEKD